MRMLVLAAFAAVIAVPAHAGNPAAGKEAARACAACHGPDGNSPAAEFPKLAGQHYDYLVRTLKDYKSGARKNAIMAPQVAKLTERDFQDLAAFYSGQQGLVVRGGSYMVPAGKH